MVTWYGTCIGRSAVVQILSDILPLFDKIYDAVMFARNYFNSSSEVLRYVANYDVHFGRMASGLGQNVFFGCENFTLSLHDLLSEKFNTKYVYDICLSRKTESLYMYCHAKCMLELLIFCLFRAIFLPQTKLFTVCVMTGISTFTVYFL